MNVRVFGLWGLAALAVAAGCTKGSYAGWDAGGMSWDPPPPRTVVDPDGGLGKGDPPGIGPGGSHAGVCTVQDQGNCCYDGKKLHGAPSCGWRRLLPGESTLVTVAFRDDQKVTLPVALTLTAQAPERFATFEDCAYAPVGFVLSGPGLEEKSIGGDISHYYLRPDGTWAYDGGGGQSGLVAASNSEITSRDGGQPAPTYTLSEGLCRPLRESKAVAVMQLFSEMDFTLGGVDYNADFALHPNESAQVTGYYLYTEKAF